MKILRARSQVIPDPAASAELSFSIVPAQRRAIRINAICLNITNTSVAADSVLISLQQGAAAGGPVLWRAAFFVVREGMGRLVHLQRGQAAGHSPEDISAVAPTGAATYAFGLPDIAFDSPVTLVTATGFATWQYASIMAHWDEVLLG